MASVPADRPSDPAPGPADAAPGAIRYGSSRGRWIVVAAVLGSGIAFIDSTVVNVALPAIEEELGGGLSGLQWTVDAYLLTLGSLIIFGGSLGDIYGRRKAFVWGLAAFTAASVLCGLAPSVPTLILARALQGVGGALLVPGSLSLISAAFHPDDRAQAIGAWSGLSGVSTAIGPFLGGYLVDEVSWRLVFLINVPIALVTIWLTLRHVPETSDEAAARKPDGVGAAAAAIGLAGIVFALIEGPVRGFSEPLVAGAAVIGIVALAAFPLVEKRAKEPMLPLGIFESSQFSGANLVTLAVYAALSGAMFFFVIQLQQSLGYSAIESGAALFPTTAIMFLLSPRVGKLSQRIGPRWPMTAGPILAGAGLALMSMVRPGATYVGVVLPGVIVFSLGLSLTVTPLTSAVLAAVEQRRAGIASGVNNAVARLAGLIAVAVLPLLSGLASGSSFDEGYPRAMLISGGLCALGGVIALGTIKQSVRLRSIVHPHFSHSCTEVMGHGCEERHLQEELPAA